jgi:hypothetical protein
MLDRGRPSDGGMWGYWFCSRCNQATGRWDQVYLRWQRTIFKLFPADLPAVGEIFGIQVNAADPGGFVRCLWAWMFALDRDFADDYPSLAVAVRDGQFATPPPADLALLIALSGDLNMWLTSQRRVAGVDVGGSSDGWWRWGNGLWAPQPQPIEMPYVVVAAPPFNIVLAPRAHEHGLPHFDLTSWLLEPAGQSRDVVISLPVVQITGLESPRPVTYDRFLPRLQAA